MTKNSLKVKQTISFGLILLDTKSRDLAVFYRDELQKQFPGIRTHLAQVEQWIPEWNEGRGMVRHRYMAGRISDIQALVNDEIYSVNICSIIEPQTRTSLIMDIETFMDDKEIFVNNVVFLIYDIVHFLSIYVPQMPVHPDDFRVEEANSRIT